MQPMDGEHFQKFNRMMRKEGRRIPRRAYNKHHMTNACKGGKSVGSNLLYIRADRHATIHRYFRNLSWEEIGDALYQMFGLRDPQKCYDLIQRVSRMKGRVA